MITKNFELRTVLTNKPPPVRAVSLLNMKIVTHYIRQHELKRLQCYVNSEYKFCKSQ